ncbi:MAG: translation initiation factor IF-3, partial [Anaerolineales bacterium]|nr:translation initiation factor IF-3 [Anaerolineales bacterium]
MSASQFRINNQIRAKNVRLIGADGDNIGVVPIEEAFEAARTADLDLVEIAPNADPPVCRVL